MSIEHQNDHERELWMRMVVKYAGTIFLNGDVFSNADTAVRAFRQRQPKSLTGTTPDKGTTDGSFSAVPVDRAVAVTEPAQGGADTALGRASTEETPP